MYIYIYVYKPIALPIVYCLTIVAYCLCSRCRGSCLAEQEVHDVVSQVQLARNAFMGFLERQGKYRHKDKRQ